MRLRRTVMTCIAVAMLAWWPAPASAVEVIPLNTPAPATLADTLRTQFPNLTVSVFQNQLILSGSESDIAQARHLVLRLDHPAASLRISVRQTRQQNQTQSDVHLSGRIDTGKIGVALGDEGPARLTLAEQDRRMQDDATQSVLTQDGARAYVAVGQTRPLTQVTRQIVNGQWVETTSSSLVDVDTGFYVQPSLHGERVQLTVYPFSAQGRPDQLLDRQQLSTQLDARLGEWIDVGQALEMLDDRQHRLLGVTQRHGEASYQVWIKVELAP